MSCGVVDSVDFLGFRFCFRGTQHGSVPEDFGVIIPDLPTIALDMPIEVTAAPLCILGPAYLLKCPTPVIIMP